MIEQLPDTTSLNNLPLVQGGQGRTVSDMKFAALVIAVVTFPVWSPVMLVMCLYELARWLRHDYRIWRQDRNRIPTGIDRHA